MNVIQVECREEQEAVGKRGKRAHAVPPILNAVGGETIGIRAQCPDGAIVLFPEPKILESIDGMSPKVHETGQGLPDRGFTYNIEPGRTCLVTLARGTNHNQVHYPISLFCKHDREFAIGNSPPEIIITDGP